MDYHSNYMKNIALNKINIMIETMKEMQKDVDFAKISCLVVEKHLSEIKDFVQKI